MLSTLARTARIAADNTDAPALLQALAELGIARAAFAALVLGAGGSARAAVWALRDAGVPAICGCGIARPTAQRLLAAQPGARAVTRPSPPTVPSSVTAPRSACGARTRSPPATEVAADAGVLGEFGAVVDYVYPPATPPALIPVPPGLTPCPRPSTAWRCSSGRVR